MPTTLDLTPIREQLSPTLHRYLPTLASDALVGILNGEASARGAMLEVTLPTALTLVRDGVIRVCEKCTVLDADHEEVHGEPPEVAMTFHPAGDVSWADVRRRAAALES